MKKFLEEYGFGILITTAIILLLCLISPLGNVIGDSAKSLVNNFSNTTSTVMNSADEATEILTRKSLASSPRLPNEYQEVEWIESHGTEEILTNLFVGKLGEFDIEIECQCTQKTSKNGIIVATNRAQGEWFGHNTVYTAGGSSSSNVSCLERKIILINFSINGVIYSVNETKYSRSGPVSAYDSLHLFKLDEFGSFTRLYSLKVEHNKVLSRNYIPCYRKSDGVIGLYDLTGSICPLTGTPFYINAGSGTFEKGPDVN